MTQIVKSIRDSAPYQVGELIWVGGEYHIVINSNLHDWTNIAFTRELKPQELETHGVSWNKYYILRRLTGHRVP
jgi:hypothetical protein